MSDVSGQALAAAKENCALLDGRCEKISFIKSDYFASLPSLPFDVIVSNPPYIKTDDLAGLACEVRDHEPRIALDGGADGLMAVSYTHLDVYKRQVQKHPTIIQ